MTEAFLFILLGILFGIITGLIPGIHINLISMFVLSNIWFLLENFNAHLLVLFIVVMSLVHTFVDFIPSILFGVPDADTSLSVLPGHVLVLNGEAFKAIFLSSIGSLFSIFFVFFIGIVFYYWLEIVYEGIKVAIPYILLITVLLLIILEKDRNRIFWAFIVVLFSGGYGMLVLNSILVKDPLLVLFTGLFGISTLVFSLCSDLAKFPNQRFDFKFDFDRKFFAGIGFGSVSSAICSVTPGIGNAQAGTLSSLFFKMESEAFIVVLSVINTINFVISIVTFYVIERARNGSIYVISQFYDGFTIELILVYFLIVVVVGIAAFFITIELGKLLIGFVERVNFKILNISIIVFLFILIGVLSEFYGVLITIGASFLGLVCLSLEIRRVHLMSVLIVPVILNLI